MSVNTMQIMQANQLIAALHKQATGQEVATPTDLSSFISVANRIQQVGNDHIYGALTIMAAKTLVAVKPYDMKFKGLEFAATEWGGIIRKISYVDRDPVESKRYEAVDGTSIDPFVIRKGIPVETRYYGKDIYAGHYTIYDEQLKEAFTGPESFGAFMAGFMTHFSNERKQWLEELCRAVVSNEIAADYNIGGDKVIHLITEYNQETGESLTPANYKNKENLPGFTKWVYARIAQVRRLMTERSQKFQLNLDAGPIMRHTPEADQKMYIDQSFLDHMRAEVLSGTYHDNYLDLDSVEGVSYWQAIENPNKVNVKPVYINAAGEVVTGPDTEVTGILGILFDRDAMGYSVRLDTMNSIYNPRGHYTNIFNDVEVTLMNDQTEKSVLFLLD